jgi:hypothetical protein
MTFSLDLWQTIVLISMVLGAFIGLLKLLMAQQVNHIDERMDAFDAANKAAFASQNVRLDSIERANREEAGNWQRIERELMAFKADLPMNYVRRDDDIRSKSVIEAKIDGLAVKIENAQLRGLINHGGNAK